MWFATATPGRWASVTSTALTNLARYVGVVGPKRARPLPFPGKIATVIILVHPTFVWVKNRLPCSFSVLKSLEIKRFHGVQVQDAAVKVDGDLQVLAIAVAVGVFLSVWIFEFKPSLVAFVMR